MIIILLTVAVMLNIKTCSANFWFYSKIRKIISKQTKDKNLKGTFKSVAYLGSAVKIYCFGRKYPNQSFRRFSWFHSGKFLSSSDRYMIDKRGILTIKGVTVEDSGEFICTIQSKAGKYKFKHNVDVIQFPSRSLHVHFVYVVRVCSSKGEEFAAHFVESKLDGICLEKECKLGYIHSSCIFEQFTNPRIKVTVPVLLPGIPNGSCNIQCMRDKQNSLKEEVKQRVISAVMRGQRLRIREEPKEIAVSYLETEEDSLCEPGFEMKGSISKSLCFPCTPGHYLEKGYCIPCHLNHYNGRYAATECQPCFGNWITQTRGATSEEYCYLVDPDVLWIVIAVFIIVIPCVLLCCCCSRRKKVFNPNKENDKKLFKNLSESQQKPKASYRTANILNRNLDEASPRRKFRDEESFGIPRVRHSVGKDFLYKPLRPVAKSIIPPPPPLPTDSVLNQAARNMAYYPVAIEGRPGTEITEDVQRETRNKMPDISLKEKGYITPEYREGLKRDKPMYNVIMKSKV